VIAASAVAKSPPDGYTLFLAPVTTMAIGPAIYKKLPYDTVKDFAPVGLVGSAQFALIANPNIGAPTLPDLIALVKSKNGQMSYGTSGASTPHHLLMEMFLHQIGAKAQHVPYRGSVPAMTDVISGQIPFMMVDLAVAMGPIQEGKLKVYGVTSPNRIKAMPDLPTIAEAGLPGYGTNGWFSVVVAAGTPRPIIDKLNGVLMPYLKRPDVQDRLNALAITPLTSTPRSSKSSFRPRCANGRRWSRTPASSRNNWSQSSRWIFACSITLAKRARSDLNSASNSSGVLPIGSWPMARMRSRTSAEAMVAATAFWIVSTISRACPSARTGRSSSGLQDRRPRLPQWSARRAAPASASCR
jgi:tripartite-type tricarboxylate transporter receptor subunit TctC